MLIRGCAGSIRPRLASVGNSSFLFEPVPLDLELAHLLIQLRLQGFLGLFLLPKPCGEEAGSLALSMFLPLGNRGGMDPIVAGKLIEGLLPCERCERHAGLEFCTVTHSLCHHLFLRLRDTALLPSLPV